MAAYSHLSLSPLSLSMILLKADDDYKDQSTIDKTPEPQGDEPIDQG